MRHSFSTILIATLCLTLTASAEDKPSPAVKRILDKAVGKVRANRTEFDKANKKPLDEARGELQELVTKLNKDGKTKEAIDTLKQVETLEADVMKMANAPLPQANPIKPAVTSPVGKWLYPALPSSSFTLNDDGTVVSSWHAEPGLWTMTRDGRVQMMILKSRSIQTVILTNDGNAMTDSKGAVLYQRIP